jgi:hypothetical protein
MSSRCKFWNGERGPRGSQAAVLFAVPDACTCGATYGDCGIQRKRKRVRSGRLLRAGRKGLVAWRGVAWRSAKRGQRSVAVQSAQAERWFRRKRHRDLIERIRSTSGLMCRGSPLFGLHATAPLSVEQGRAHPRAMAERRMLSSAAAIVIDTFLELILHTRRHRCESHTLANAR